MHVLNAENISKAYSDQPLFQGVSFGISSGDKIGLIGSNGSGKSTLAGIVAGNMQPDSGEIVLGGEVRVHYLPQFPEFDSDSTIIQEVFRGEDPALQALCRYHSLTAQVETGQEELAPELARLNIQLDNLNAWQVESSAKAALTRLGIEDFSREISSLSGGERKRVALARALITPCDLLVLDEPTNHLDTGAILWLEDFLQKRTGALLMITHDRWLLSRVSNRILELDRGGFLDCSGGYQRFLEQKAEWAEKQQAALRKHRAALKRELTWMLQGAKARSTKEKTRKDRYQELKDQTFLADKSAVELDIASSRLGKKVIELADISICRGGKQLVREFSYTLLPRDRIGIVGPNGSGKSSLLDVIAGLVPPESGDVQRGETVKIGYYRQQAGELDENKRVLEYARGIREAVKTASGEMISVGKMLEQFLFTGPSQWTYIRDLSGGERRRLYLLGILMEEPNVLLLDEPTNDLDIDTLTVLEHYLDDFPGAVVAVSHDRWFLDKTTEHLFCLDGQGGIERYTGSFSDFLARQAPAQQGDADKDKRPQRPRRQKTKLSYREQQEYDGLEAEIDELQGRVDELVKEQAEAGSDFVRLAELHKEQEKLEQELEQKMTRWLELEQRKEELAQCSRTGGQVPRSDR
ncbi:MAG: ABC-F family ATP-binding cassette domain-containing protein [Firmicutes bacterium]|nr:ABC-F family ATP-binding cassette domain-containing protein [Bacillota bacterium]